jgi:hypothetical protein
MSAQMILNRLHTLGVSVTLRGDRLAVRPSGRLTPELRQAIQEHKPDLMLLLAGVTAPYREGPPYPDSLGRVKCFYCERCEISGTRALCGVSKKSVSGIALLITCSEFTMTTMH